MYILALHEDSNANITLLHNQNVVYSVAEERLTRIKYKGGFPYASLADMKERFNITLRDVDHIVCGNPYHPTPRLLGKHFPSFEHPFLGISQKVSLTYQDALESCGTLRSMMELLNYTLLRMRCKRNISFVHHHDAHAYSAYYSAGYPDTTIITSDNFGDGISTAVYQGCDGKVTRLYHSRASHSPGQYYGELAQFLGFHPLLAGKMTGLAAHGCADTAYDDIQDLFALSPSQRDFVLPPLWSKSFDHGIFKRLRKYDPKDIAAAAQKRFEDVMIQYVQEALRITRCPRLCVAGGIFANVRLNQRIAEIPSLEHFFVHPAMSDQGISYGAAMAYTALHSPHVPSAIETVYWGPEYSDQEIEQALKNERCEYTYDASIERTIALLLHEGHVVARFNGKLEYGPRALGNRSILYKTTDPSVNTWLNEKLHRAEFMPFAPVTLEDYAEKCYRFPSGAKKNMYFMTMCVDCTEYMKQTSPGVVHLDGTARPQLISYEKNPSYYTILKEYHKLSGIPSLINTSFNMHEEPIVCTPHDAIRALRASALPYLAIGNYLVRNR